MNLTLKTVGVIVADMSKTLAFYRTLGLPIPVAEGEEDNIDVPLDSGITLGFLSEAMARRADPHFVTPVGGSLNLQFECESPAEVDAVFRTLTAAGYAGYTEPWDAFWGQRFARVTDPDARIVNLYAHL